ncbi:uncharacterized protein LOC141876525 isoform X2 [Acropora palmata]|uniref:uncharacterized protein LOC141876525 isoform X2 n=1 Tax=Acropora palmata TaxID=6131 RepID=UPI003DA0334F
MSNTSCNWVEDSTRQNQSSVDVYSELASVDSQRSLPAGDGSSPVGSMHQVASPRTSKKRNFLHTLSKGTSRRGTSITRPMNRDGMTGESHDDTKEGDADRIRIMKMVKEGLLSVEDAMVEAKNLGITTSAEHTQEDTSAEEKIFNFGVYKYDRDRTSLSRRILQIDFQEKVLCIIQRGNRNKKFAFSDLKGFDSEDGVRFYTYFDNDYELDADSVEEKNKICSLLESIVQQTRGDQADGMLVIEQSPQDAVKVIKEGQVEKKGHNAAFMMWPRRWLRIQSGELSYFKIGEEKQTALNIVKLGPGLAEVKSVDHNTFVVVTSKKEYSFRVLNVNNVGDQLVEKERDSWIEAIAKASQVNFHRSKIVSPPDEQVISLSVEEQEKYLRDIVKTLQRELEQLASVLSVVNAPIQATVQVKKVKDVVKNLDSQVKTGLLAWTMRQVLQSRKDSREENFLPQNRKETQGNKGNTVVKKSPPGRKDSDRLPSLPAQQEDGYEAVEMPKRPLQPKPVHLSPDNTSPSDYPSPSIHSAKAVSSRTEWGSNSSENVYEAVEMKYGKPKDKGLPYSTDLSSSRNPPQLPKPGSSVVSQDDETSSIYQTPRSLASAASLNLIYDNVKLKNVPLSHQDGQSHCANMDESGTYHSGPFNPEVRGSEETIDGKFEIDSGGMGCKDILSAMEERRQILEESESREGVVLLSVTKGDLEKSSESPRDAYAAEEIGTTSLAAGSNPPPPPPILAGGVPPPPPLMMEGTAFRTCAVQSKLKLRPFFWNKIPNNLVSNSLWVDASDRTKSINLELLEDMFHVEEKEKNPNSVQAKATAKTLLDPKRAQNLGIFLSGFKMTAKQIDEKLSQFRGEEALPMDQVIALKRFLPSAEEAEMYKNYKEDPSTLVPEDQFMMKLCEIKDLEKRLDLLLVVMEFPTQYEDLAPNVDNLLQACQQLYYSKNFLLVLEYVLSIGNILNSGSNRGGAYGFRLQSLPKLADIRGNNKKNTLLKFLILQLENSNPDALNFTGELKSVTKAAACSSKALFAEVEVMKKDLVKIKKLSSDILLKRSQTNSQDVKLHNDVELFVNEYEEKLNLLCEKCKEMKQIYNKVLVSFGEPQSSDSEELFGAISTFMGQFEKALKETQGNKHNKSIKGLKEAIEQRKKSTEDNISVASKGSSTAADQDNVDAGKPNRTMQSSEESINVGLETKQSIKAGPSPVIHKKLSTKPPSKPTAKTGPKPTKQGFLEKLSGGKHQSKKWDNRYFELTDTGNLYYYKKADGGKPINSIYLKGCPVNIDPNDASVLIVKTEDRDWNLKAVNFEEACAWRDALLFYSEKN